MKTIEISDIAWENLEKFKNSLLLNTRDFISRILENFNLFSLFRIMINSHDDIHLIGADQATFEKIRELCVYFGKSFEEFVRLCFDEQTPLKLMGR